MVTTPEPWHGVQGLSESQSRRSIPITLMEYSNNTLQLFTMYILQMVSRFGVSCTSLGLFRP